MFAVLSTLSFVFLNVHSAHQNSPDDEARVLKALIYQLYVDNGTKVDELPENLVAIGAALKTDFRPKDFWNDKEYSFGYGKSPNGAIILFAWKNDRNFADSSLATIKERYLDDRFAEIQDSKNLETWKSARKDIAGSFMGLRRGDLNGELPLAAEKTSSAYEKLTVGSYPLILIVTSSETESKKIRKDKSAAVADVKDKIN